MNLFSANKYKHTVLTLAFACCTFTACADDGGIETNNPDRADSAALSSLLWPGGDVYIVVETDFFDFNIAWTLKDAASFLETNTAIRVHFIDSALEAPGGNYVRFSGTDGWWDEGFAPVGISAGMPAEATSLRAVHMLGHIVGLNHTQNRIDRNDHVTVHPTWILEGEEAKFVRYSDTLLVGPYDTESVMHSASGDGARDLSCATISIGQNDPQDCVHVNDERYIPYISDDFSYWNTVVLSALYCDVRLCEDRCAPVERCELVRHNLSALKSWGRTQAGRQQAAKWPDNSLFD